MGLPVVRREGRAADDHGIALLRGRQRLAAIRVDHLQRAAVKREVRLEARESAPRHVLDRHQTQRPRRRAEVGRRRHHTAPAQFTANVPRHAGHSFSDSVPVRGARSKHAGQTP